MEQNMATPLVEMTKTSTNCLWKIIKSKRLAKYALQGITLLFMFISFLIICFNHEDLVAKTYYIYYDVFIGGSFMLLFNLYPFVAGFIICIGIFGILAAIKENAKVVRLFGIFLLAAFAVNAVIGATMVVQALMKSDRTYEKLEEVMRNYETDDNAKVTMDALHFGLHCCGNRKLTDWQAYLQNNFVNDHDRSMIQNVVMPNSCFSTQGCNLRLYLALFQIMTLVLAVSSLLGILLLLSALMAFRLESKLLEPKQKTLFCQTLSETTIMPNGTSSAAIFTIFKPKA